MDFTEQDKDDPIAVTVMHARQKIDALEAELARYRTLLAAALALQEGQEADTPHLGVQSTSSPVTQRTPPSTRETIGTRALSALAANPSMTVPEVTKALYGPAPTRSNGESVRTSIRRLYERGVLVRDEKLRYKLAEVGA